jgi:hypothetical protein
MLELLTSVTASSCRRYSRPGWRQLADEINAVSGSQTSLNATSRPEIPVLEQLDFNFCWFGRNSLAAVAVANMDVGPDESILFPALTTNISQLNETVPHLIHSRPNSEHRRPKTAQ